MSEAKVRMRIAAAVSAAPARARFRLQAETWAEQFARAFAGLEVEVPDLLGAGATRRFALSAATISGLTLAGVIKNDATLFALAELAKRAAGTDAWLAELERVTGSGILLAACRAVLAPAAASSDAPEAPEGAPAGGEDDPIERLFAKASVAHAPGKAALDAFVRALRPAGRTSPAATSAARPLRALVEEAVYGTARAVLEDPAVARLESRWRALRWILENAPSTAGIAIEIVDASPEDALDALRAIERDDDFESPDLFVLADPVVADLAEVAAWAEGERAPCLAAIEPAFATLTPDALIERLGVKDRESATEEARAYHGRRVDESTRWVSLAFGDVVVLEEGTGAFERTVFTSPALALVAMLAASYASTGSFARILGQVGQLRAPGVHAVAGQDLAIPTRHFTSIRAQTELANLGVIALGSPRNSDRVMLSSASTLRASRDAVPLPAQLWTGRIVRFAEWARRQLPPGAGADEIREIFEQAGDVFLFPSVGRAARITATLEEKDGARSVAVGARMDGSLALIPLEIEFALPI